MFDPAGLRTDAQFVLQKVVPRPAWDMDSLTWNPRVLAQSLPHAISAGFEFKISCQGCSRVVRVIFLDAVGSERALSTLEATVLYNHENTYFQIPSLEEFCSIFERSVRALTLDRLGLYKRGSSVLRGESRLALCRNLELRINLKRSDAMNSIKITLRDRAGTLRRCREMLQREWRFLKEMYKTRRLGKSNDVPSQTFFVPARPDPKDVKLCKEIFPEPVTTRAETRHYWSAMIMGKRISRRKK